MSLSNGLFPGNSFLSFERRRPAGIKTTITSNHHMPAQRLPSDRYDRGQRFHPRFPGAIGGFYPVPNEAGQGACFKTSAATLLSLASLSQHETH